MRRHDSTTDQGGYSLVEVLVSLALTSTVVLGLIAGMLVTLRSMDSNGSGAEAAAALDAVSDRVRSVAYRACTTPTQLSDDVRTAPYPVTYAGPSPVVQFLQVRQWNRATGSFDPAGAPCVRDGGAVLVRVRVTVGDVSETGEFTYRNPTAVPT